jgi:hypothetical protein
MEKTILIKSIFIFIALWGFSVAFLWFRPRIEVSWKIIATLIFAFYIRFFFEEILSGFDALSSDWYLAAVNFLKELVALVFVNLFFLWPISLIIIFYKSDDIGSERILKFMCLLTVALWAIFLAYVYHSRGIDDFLYHKLKEMIPYAQ